MAQIVRAVLQHFVSLVEREGGEMALRILEEESEKCKGEFVERKVWIKVMVPEISEKWDPYRIPTIPTPKSKNKIPPYYPPSQKTYTNLKNSS